MKTLSERVVGAVNGFLDPDGKTTRTGDVTVINVIGQADYPRSDAPSLCPVSSNANISDGIYTIRNKGSSGLYVGIADDGTTAVIQARKQINSQAFSIRRIRDGTYTITAVHSGKVLEVSGNDYGAVVQLAEWQGTDNQRWIITDCGGGWYKLTAKHSGLIFDVAGGVYAEGTTLQQAKENGCPAQRYRFIANNIVDLMRFTDVTREWGDKIITLKCVNIGNFVVANVDSEYSPLQVRAWNADFKKKFETYLTKDGYIGFRNMRNRMFVTADLREDHVPLRAIADKLKGAWECFKIFTDGKYFYIQYRDGERWISVDNTAKNALVAKICEPSSWERFIIELA
ncbi:MAG: RICIN domain-containing protein [Oscillospiraceae bacterium]|nr:RICIN domain-containing protein [Oscillospiraceae bacterium]